MKYAQERRKNGILYFIQGAHHVKQRRELIVFPRQLDGLLAAIHLKLSHPTKHLVGRRNFYALDLDSAIERAIDTCRTCMSLLKLPQTLSEQYTTHLPDSIAGTFAADYLSFAEP